MQNWEKVIDFPDEKIEQMQQIIEEKRRQPELSGLFVNKILREDIFDILDACCTVVFYPLPESEENDGFQVSRAVDYGGEHIEQFVFLNTAKPLEKQVFTAGHELGHIWDVADQIWDDELEKIFPRLETEEAAMNRFSAELLMPQEQFQKSAQEQLNAYRENGKIKIINGIRVVASLMNEFCVPAHAVVRRLYETKCLSRKSCEQLLFTGAGKTNPEEYQIIFQETLHNCIEEGGYTRLNKPTNKRGIKDFPQILNEAEKKDIFSKEQAERLRTLLSIPTIDEEKDGLDSESLE